MSTQWTPELVNQLRERWERGETSTAIAAALGLTRNTVLGKANRLRLSSRGCPIRDSEQAAVARKRRDLALTMLAEYAERGEPCPTNGQLCDALGMTSASSVGRVFGDLEAAGAIRVRWEGARRAVLIVATGRETALPVIQVAPKPAGPVWVRRLSRGTDQRKAAADRAEAAMREHRRREASAVEQAKLFLQRSGRVVYSATVRGGPAGAWYVSGVAKPIGADDLVALAASRGFNPNLQTGMSA